MLHKGKGAIKAVLFLLVLAAGVWLAGQLLYPENGIAQNWRSFYAQEPGSIDILIMGNSHAYASFDAPLMEKELGRRVYILGSNSQTVMGTYYNAQEVLRFQKPSTIVLEAYAINDEDWTDPETDGNWEKLCNTDGMRWGLPKLRSIAAEYAPKSWFECFFPILHSHGNWKNLNTVKLNLSELGGDLPAYEPFRPSVSSMSDETVQAFAGVEYDPTPFKVCEANREAFVRLAALCRQNGIRLLVIMAPMYAGFREKTNYASRQDELRALCEGENVEFFDCNDYYDAWGFEPADFEDSFTAITHLNGGGAEKLTRQLLKAVTW